MKDKEARTLEAVDRERERERERESYTLVNKKMNRLNIDQQNYLCLKIA